MGTNKLEVRSNFKLVPAVALEGFNVFMELEIAGVVFKDNPPEEIFLSPNKTSIRIHLRKYEKKKKFSQKTLPF